MREVQSSHARMTEQQFEGGWGVMVVVVVVVVVLSKLMHYEIICIMSLCVMRMSTVSGFLMLPWPWPAIIVCHSELI